MFGCNFTALMAFGMLYPNEKMFIIPMPFPIKAKYFVMGYAVIEIVEGLMMKDGVAHFAHLGGYTEYRSFLLDNAAVKKKKEPKEKQERAPRPQVRKLSYKEKKEFEELDTRLATLNEEKLSIEARLSGSTADYEEISRLSDRYSELKDELDEAELRWLELSCIAEGQSA